MSVSQLEALDEAQAREVLAAWVKARRAELPEALARSPSKLHVRLAKKALYQLRSAGVAVAEPAAQPPVEPGSAPAAAKDELPAMLSAILGTGERAFCCGRLLRGGGVELAQGVFSDEHGITQLDAVTTNRNLYRENLRAMQGRGLTLIEVPAARVLEELGRALARNDTSRTPLPPEAGPALQRLGVTPNLADDEIPLPGKDDEALWPHAASLHQEPELAQWYPAEPMLRVLSARVDEVRTSPLQLSPAQRFAQLAQKVELTAKEAFTPAVRSLYARRLWKMAEVFARTARARRGLQCSAEAKRLLHTDQPSPFIERMFEKAIPPEVAQPQADAEPAPPQQTAGGIIIP
jgi:hypothetical protein